MTQWKPCESQWRSYYLLSNENNGVNRSASISINNACLRNVGSLLGSARRLSPVASWSLSLLICQSINVLMRKLMSGSVSQLNKYVSLQIILSIAQYQWRRQYNQSQWKWRKQSLEVICEAVSDGGSEMQCAASLIGLVRSREITAYSSVCVMVIQ